MDVEEKNMQNYFGQIKEFIINNSLNGNVSKLFTDFHMFHNESIFLLDYQQNKIVYKKGFQNVLGYSDDVITNDFIIKNIHPDEVDIVTRIIRAAITYCIEHPKNSSNNLLIIKHRMRKRNGTYIHVINQSSVFDVDESGRISTALVRFTDVTGMDVEQKVSWTFKASDLNEMAFKSIVYKSYKNFFTKREIEIISEIQKGYTNKLIGVNLKISEHTVSTHRKNILKKSNCHNSDELISFCQDKCIF
jgi:DNA-binding CsgD family transcriptional regulator